MLERTPTVDALCSLINDAADMLGASPDEVTLAALTAITAAYICEKHPDTPVNDGENPYGIQKLEAAVAEYKAVVLA